ncbi:MAG: hypothetical protein KGH57_02235 [Candidatus Micrarchaeota archaeon]|nr:hypothetical protein [Candidatus Micrarchaeota archaeon]
MKSGPLYKIEAQDGGSSREITIDVTRSASSFPVLGEGLRKVLGTVLRDTRLGIKDVVEFGAGKLKNVPFILEMGKNVCAVEFEELNSNPIAQSNYTICRGYDGHFRRLDPEEFVKDSQKFDLALIINVIPTMPIASERDAALKLLNHKLRNGKFALWFALKGDDVYKERQELDKTCLDGVWLGEGKHLQTFYKNYTVDDVMSLMHNAGFMPFNRFHVETNHALLFRKG